MTPEEIDAAHDEALEVATLMEHVVLWTALMIDANHDEAIELDRARSGRESEVAPMTLGSCGLCGRKLTNDELQAETVPIMALIVGGPAGAGQVCDRCRRVQCPTCGSDTADRGSCEACGAPQVQQ
jgi:hypothetical protein